MLFPSIIALAVPLVGVALDIFIKMMSTVATTLFVVIAVISGLIGLI